MSAIPDANFGSITVLCESGLGSRVNSRTALAAPKSTKPKTSQYHDSIADSTRAEEVGSDNEDIKTARHKRDKRNRKKGDATITKKMKSPPRTSTPQPTDNSSPERPMLANNRGDNGSPTPVRTLQPFQPPKPIRPVVGDIARLEAQRGSVMEDWEVNPGIMKTQNNEVNLSAGYGKFMRRLEINFPNTSTNSTQRLLIRRTIYE
jgi:hypothetical protein